MASLMNSHKTNLTFLYRITAEIIQMEMISHLNTKSYMNLREETMLEICSP